MDFNIPKAFTLGGVEHVVEIQQVVGYEQDFGQYDPVRKVIQIAQICGSRDVPQSFQQQTFLHELVHAILNTMRKDDLYDDESFVNTFASFLNEAINTMEYADQTETFLQLLRVLHTNIRGHLLPSVAIRAESGLRGVLKT